MKHTNFIKLLFVFFLILSCKNELPIRSNSPHHSEKSYTKNYNVMPIKEDNHIIKERHYVSWRPKVLKDGRLSSIQFHGDIATFWIDNKSYNFPIKKTGIRNFNLYWSIKTVASTNGISLNQTNGIGSFPMKDDLFAKYTVINDSLIEAKYEFSEWTTKINIANKDSIFPQYLYFFE